MIARQLETALQEAIQHHADHYRHGQLDLEQILTALGKLAASYIAEMPLGDDWERLFLAHGQTILKTLDSKARARRTATRLIS